MSSSEGAISVHGIGKSYTIAQEQETHNTLAEAMLARVKHPLRRSARETFWALSDVSFDVKKGEVIGIIGRNGAGKSTLLKILSRITEPTNGYIDIRGRVGSLLEVGTGFHPELTGRENIFLNGAILGMSKADIRTQFDAIVEFAEVEAFLDTPVKRYSSGMYVRLAFAVAAHLNPEILIVDEVLAVGDLQFQRKCLAKMEDVSQSGRTVLLVSHNMHSIAQLCSRVAWFDAGKLVAIGAVNELVSRYITGDAESSFNGERSWNGDAAPGNSRFKLLGVRMLDAEGAPICCAGITEPYSFEIDYAVQDRIRDLRVYFIIADLTGQHVLSSTDVDSTPDCHAPRKVGSYRSRGEVWRNLLKPGEYDLHVGAVDHGTEQLCMVERVFRFQISTGGETFARDWHLRQGAVAPRFDWTVSRLDAIHSGQALVTR